MKRKQTIRVLIIVICLYLAFTTIQGTVGLFSAGEKVTRRESELAKLMEEKRKLEIKEKQIGSKEFLDQVAYDQLGLSKPGEKVIIIPKELLADNSSKVVVVDEPNWKKWVELIL